MHLEKAIKYLQVGNNDAAAIHLNAGHQAISCVSVNAKELYEAGMKALSTDDLSGALEHLKAAEEKLI